MMPVYVDPLFDTEGWTPNWPYPEACHLTADTEEELHAFAARIGMRRAWFQASPPHSVAHYDLARKRRAMAVRLGAVEVCAGFFPSRRHFRWVATGRTIVATPAGATDIMRIPTHWPDGTPMKFEHRIHFMAFRCGVVYCETCGDVVAECGCGKKDEAHLVPSCPSCKPEEHGPLTR